MNQTLKNTILVFGLIGLLFACGKDDTTPTTPAEENNNSSYSTATSGYIIINSVRYPLTSAIQAMDIDTNGNFDFAPYRASRIILYSDKPFVRQDSFISFDSTAIVACYSYIFSKDVSSSLLGTFPISSEADTSKNNMSWIFGFTPSTEEALFEVDSGSIKFESLGNNTYKMEIQALSKDSTEVQVLLQGAMNDQP